MYNKKHDMQQSLISDNIKYVREKIELASRRSGRTSEDVKLVAVTKTRTVEEIREAINCGVTDIGENYIQEAVEKYEQLGDIVKWHMIGHLQSNKARFAVKFSDLIHSVDSLNLAREIGRRAVVNNKVVKVLLEVNISEEISKHGTMVDSFNSLLDSVSYVEGIKISGLMGMAPFVNNPEETRPYFAKLKALWDKLPNEQRLYLSMGMTQDYEIAIEEGSNLVRIGTAIFGSRG